MNRIKPASDTLRYLLKNLDGFGISRLADLSYLDGSINLYIYSAVRPNAKSLTTSMGKGVTIDEAKCSALMESIETFYAEEVLPDITTTSFKEIAYRNLMILNPNEIRDVARISEDFSLDWCFGKLLNSQKDILIPHVFLSLNSNQVMTKLVGQNSDGLASGNSFDEAIVYSFWELNERISLKNDKLYLDVDRKYYSSYINDILSASFFIYRNEFDLPVIGCYICNQNPVDNQIIFAGYSCRSNLHDAVLNALFEAIQSKVGIISGVRDDIDSRCYSFSSKRLNGIQSDMIDTLSFCPFVTQMPINSEINKLKGLLSKHQKDLAYYIYQQNDITILKSFLVDLC